MEGIACAASIVTLAGLALGSTRAIYNIVSQIKSDSKTLERTARALQSLERVLKQISDYSGQLTTANHLRDHVLRCSADLAAFERKLSKLRNHSGSGKLERAWKRLRGLISDDEIHQLWTIIEHHINLLNLELSVVGGWVSVHSDDDSLTIRS